MSDYDLITKRRDTADAIRTHFDEFSSIEDDSLLLTEYIYKYPEQYEKTKHLLPEVTLQEIETSKERAMTLDRIEPEKSEEATDVVGWEAKKWVKNFPKSFLHSFDVVASFGDPAFDRKFIKSEDAFDVSKDQYDREVQDIFVNKIADREKEYKERLDEWYTNNPAAYAHEKYKELNSPEYWNPLSWDKTDFAKVATSAVLEVGSQLVAARFGVGTPYMYTRIFGEGVGRRLEELEKQGYTPDQALNTAISLSNISGLGQTYLERYIPNKILKQEFGSNVIDKFGRLAAEKIGRGLTRAGMGMGTKAGRVADYALMTGANTVTTGFQEALTEYGQFVFDKAIDKVGYDKSMDFFKEMGSQEAAQDFWGGFFGGGIPGSISAGINNRGLLTGKYNFEFNAPDGGKDQEKFIDKKLAEYTAPTPEIKEQADALIDGVNEGATIATIGAVKLAEDIVEDAEKRKKVRSDEAIVIDKVLSGEDKTLSAAEEARFDAVISETGLSPQELLPTIVTPESAIEAGFSPEVVAEHIQDTGVSMPENLQEYAPIPEEGEPFIQEQFIPEQFIPEPPEQQYDPVEIRRQELESLRQQGAPVSIPTQKPDIPSKSVLSKMNNSELQGILSNMNMNTSGKKADLIARIINAPKGEVPPEIVTEVKPAKKTTFISTREETLFEEIDSTVMPLEGLELELSDYKKGENALSDESLRIIKDEIKSRKEAKKLKHKEGQINLFDLGKNENRIIPHKDSALSDSAAESLSLYLGGIKNRTGDSFEFLRSSGKIKLPKKLKFTDYSDGRKYTIVKAEKVLFKDANRKNISPEVGFYNLIDSKGNVIDESFPVTKEAKQLTEDYNERQRLKNKDRDIFYSWIFDGKKIVQKLDPTKVIGKRYSPHVSSNVAMQLAWKPNDHFDATPFLRKAILEISNESFTGLTKEERALKNKDLFISRLSQSLMSARDNYTGSADLFENKVNAIMNFLGYLPKNIFMNLMTFVDDFDGTNYGYHYSIGEIPMPFVAPWRGVVEKIYDSYNLDKSKINLINTDKSALEGWFIKAAKDGTSYVDREKAVINHFMAYHGKTFGKVEEREKNILFAMAKANDVIAQEIKKSLDKRLGVKGVKNFKMMPLVLMLFDKHKWLTDEIFQTPIHELVHHIQFLSQGTPKWNKMESILNKIMSHPKMKKDFYDAFEVNYASIIEDMEEKGGDSDSYIKAELFAHILQRVIWDDLGVSDKYSSSQTDSIIDDILNEGKKGQTLYDKIKKVIFELFNWIKSKISGRPFDRINTVFEDLMDIKEAFYDIIYDKKMFEEDLEARDIKYMSVKHYNRIVKSEEDVFRAFDAAWKWAQENPYVHKSQRIDADKFLNSLSNTLDSKNLGEMKLMLHRWIDKRSEQGLIDWNRYLRDKNADIGEFNWMSGASAEAMSEQLYYDQLHLLEDIDIKSLHVRKSGNLIDYIPLYTLGITLTKKQSSLLAQSAKRDIPFKEWLSSQSKITLVSPNVMTSEQKRMMHIYFLRIRQSLNTNQPMLFRTNSDIYSKIPENQRTYLQLKKVFTSKRYGLNYKMNIKPIDVHTTKPDGFRDIVGIDRPRTAVPTIADIVIPEATDGIYWLSSSEFFQGNWRETNQGMFKPYMQPSYNFLQSEDLLGISMVSKDVAFMTVRGDSRIGFFAKISGVHKDIASSKEEWSKYWNAQKKAGFITSSILENQLNMFKDDDVDILSTEIAFYDKLNGLIPGFAKWNGADVIKRIKIPMTPVISPEGLSDQKIIKVDKRYTKFRYKGKETSLEMDIEDVGTEGIFDGALISGRDHFNEMHDLGATEKDAGSLKTIWYHQNEKNHLFMGKLAQFRARPGMQWLNMLDDVIARVDKDGLIRTPAGDIIQHIGTQDEIKYTSGEYDGYNKVLTIPGKSVGIIQYVGERKSKVKFLRQVFNFIPDNRFTRDFIKHIVNKKVKRSLIASAEQLQTNEGISKFLNRIIKDYPDVASNVYKKAAAIGLGRHPMISTMLFGHVSPEGLVKYKGLIVDKVINDAINLYGFKGTKVIFEPNFDMSLGEMEFRMSYSNAKFLRKEFKDQTGLQATIGNMNKWLKRSEVNLLIGRSPVAHPAGMLYMRLTELAESNDIIQFNPVTVKRYFDADQDFDSAYVLQLPEDVRESASQYYNSEDFQKYLRGMSLSKYVKRTAKSLMDKDSRNGLVEAMNLGEIAISQIANIQMIYGIINSILKKITIGGIEYRPVSPDTEIVSNEINKGFKESLHRTLRMYLQSSVDNAKYLLLDQWNWTRNSLISKVFIDKNGNHPDENAVDIINKTIWQKAREAVFVLNSGEVGNQFGFRTLLDTSSEYYAFVTSRLEDPNRFIPIAFDGKVSYEFNDVLNVNEQLAIMPAKVFEHGDGVTKLTKEIFGDDPNKINSQEYTPAAHIDAHLYAVKNTTDRFMAYVNNNKDLLFKKYNVKDVDALIKRVGFYGKKYAKELSTSIFNSTGAGRGRPIFPNKWDTNDALIGLREKYYERFKKLSPLARRIATTEFLNIISEKKDGQKNIRLDAIPPIIDSIEKETLLDLAIMKAYGKSYDKRLDDANEIRDELKCL